MNSYFEQTGKILEDAVAGMTDEQMSATRNGKWSAAQIIEHLSLAFGATAAGMERNCAAEKLDVRGRTMRDRVATLAVVSFGYIPTGRKAPDYTVPSGIAPAEAMRKMRENLVAMDEAIDRSEKKWGDQIIAVHPVLGPLKADQWRKFHMVHAQHHAKQILAIKNTQQLAASN